MLQNFGEKLRYLGFLPHPFALKDVREVKGPLHSHESDRLVPPSSITTPPF